MTVYMGGRSWSRLLVAILVVCASVSHVGAVDSRPVVASASELDYPPMCVVEADGSAGGFAVELLRAALDAVGRDVTFRVGPWAQVRGWLEAGEVAALPLVGRTPEREPLYDFTFPYLSLHGVIVVRNDEGGIRDLENLRGRDVAVMAGDNAEEFLRRGGFSTELQTVPSFEDALRELSSGRHDAVVVQRIVALRLIQKQGLRNLRVLPQPLADFRQDWCFAVREGDRDTLALLNEGLAVVMADGTFRRLYTRWFAALELPDTQRLVVGGDRNYPPYEYLDDQGRPVGYNVELTRALAKEVGRDVEVRLGDWDEVRQGLEDGELTAVQGMFYSPERAKVFDFSPPHTVVHHVAVVRRSGGVPPSTVEGLRGLRLVVMRGDIMQDYAAQHDLGEGLLAVGSQEEALRAVVDGRADCALVARLPARYWIERNGWGDRLTVGTRPLLSAEYCYAVRRGQGALAAELAEGLAALEKTGEYRRIRDKWLGVYEEGDRTVLARLRPAAWVVLPLVVLLLGVSLWSWSLRRQVAQRTQQLARSEGLLNKAQGIAHIGGFEWDVARRELFWTDETWRIHDLEPGTFAGSGPDLVAMSIACYAPEDRGRVAEAFERCVREGTPYDLECGFVTTKGRRLLVHTAGRAQQEGGRTVRVVGHFQDVTEHHLLEEQLRQVQKMESIGRLAGGVAHDFNNMLGVIIGNAEFALAEVEAGGSVRESLDEIMKAAERSAEITRQLLAFARKQTIAPRVLDLNTTVDGLLRVLGRLIGEHIDLAWKPGPGLWPVKLDPVQVDQILANLTTNARDAIGDAGHITIETDNVVVDASYSAGHTGVAPGEYVRLTVADDGAGMDRATRDRVFEPFFTTKGVGQGTGLGLATVYGIAQQNGGFVTADSEPGSGSTFRVHLPRSASETVDGRLDEAAEVPRGRGETVLLVEDEPAILELARRMLDGLGYTVLTAAGPSVALRLSQERADEIHLVVTDVIMPEMNGRVLADRLRSTRPALRVLFMSGYTANVIEHLGVLDEDVHFVQKPFTRRNLARAVRAALDAPPGA